VKAAILGAGAWGSALAISLAARHQVSLWSRDPGLASDIAARRENQRYLPGCRLPDNVAVDTELAPLVATCDLALLAVPTAGLREAAARLFALRPECPTLWACKGFERGTGELPHQVVRALGAPAHCGVLSGPSFAREVALGLPTALTVASAEAHWAGEMARGLQGPRLRVYSSTDVIGVELGGALKNVIAIAAGLSDGMQLGENARAALITRGLAEIVRLGTHFGGRAETFDGLTGLGDLVLTCSGTLSRNRRVGLELASGAGIQSILGGLGHVAEGVMTAHEALRLARELGVDMPITEAVCAVLEGALTPHQAVQRLLERDSKPESAAR